MEGLAMKTSRRRFLKANSSRQPGGRSAASAPGADVPRSGSRSQNPRYAKLDEILSQPVLKRELFASPVIIETLELLRYKDSFLCRVRSRDGAEGISVGHSGLERPLPDLPPQPATVLHRQRCAGPGLAPGEGLHLRLQFQVQRHFHWHAVGHDRVCHPRPAGTHRQQVHRPVDWGYPSPGGRRLPGDGIPRKIGRGILGPDQTGCRRVQCPRRSRSKSAGSCS